MSHLEHYQTGTESRAAWAAGRATCPECKRFGCRGQCGCRCEGCKATALDAWAPEACDVIRDMRERSTPEGREAQAKAYREELAGRGAKAVTWGECVAQVERTGCPHHVLSVARKPEPRFALEGAKRWWNISRAGKPTLLLSDGTGTGKSVAAAWCAIKYAEARRWWLNQATGETRVPLVWLNADELSRLSLLRDEDELLLERAGACELLIIDELGALGGKAGLLAMAQLVARRIDSGKPLVITTNTSGAELSTALGRHVVDRLKTACLVKNGGKSGRAA